MTDSDQTSLLLAQARSGDKTAYHRLLERHRPRLLAAVQRRLNPRLVSRVDPADVVQEAHLEALQRRDDYLRRQPMPFSLWLLKTAHQRLVKIEREHLRSAKRSVDREIPLPDQSSLALAHALVDNRLSPSRYASREEASRLIRRTLAKMSESSREIVLLRTFEGLSNREASDLLEISAETAKKRYARAILQLQQLLDDQGHTESSL